MNHPFVKRKMETKQQTIPMVFNQVIFSLNIKYPATKLAKTLNTFNKARIVESGKSSTS